MFVLIETEKNAPNYAHPQLFNNEEDAKEEMRSLYHTYVIEGDPDIIESAYIEDTVAGFETNDGNIIQWEIKYADPR